MTFPTGVIEIRKCSDEELKTMLDEAREASKYSRKLGRVVGIVAAHRLQQMKKILAYEELTTRRRMNGFDRVGEGKENWFHGHRSLPPTPQEYHASLRHELQELKDAISMPNEKFARPKRPVEKRGREDEEPRQKTMNVVDGRRSDSLDELLANFEFARIKEYVEKRSREDTVQRCSPCLPDPEPSPSVYIKLENNEGKMGPELEEHESPSAGTGLETPGQQCPSNEGIWETERTTASGILTADVDHQGGNLFSTTTESVDTRASEKRTRNTADTTFLQQGHNPRSEQNKHFDPGGKREKAPSWNAAVILLCFLGESWEAVCLFSVCALCSVFFLNCFSFQVLTFQRS